MLSVFGLDNCQKWNEIVKSFSDYDVYYLPSYTKAFYLHGDGQPLLFYYYDNNLRAINVVMKRDISNDEHFSDLEKNKYFDFSTPYGYGGWLIEGDGSLTNLFDEYKSWCKSNGIISDVIRFHPILGNQKKVKSFYDVMDLGKTISIDLSDKDAIWSNFSSKNRNVIRKAIKNGILIKHDLNEVTIKEFKNIYNQTMDRDNAENYYYFDDNFYNSIKNDLSNNADIFYALYEDKVIASSIILKSNKRLSYHLSGSLKEYGSLAATNLLLYEVSKWGSDNGYKTFHLGGGVGSKEDSLYAFKKAFSKNEGCQYSIGKMIFNKQDYDKLVSLRKGSKLRENYFPLYRA